jgi:DNA-directed RNA polymerase specialized sigma24 family protein
MLRLIPFFTTEAQLIVALKRGESRAHKVVYERFAGKMLAVCTRYCANRDDAEEVMLDGFMRVFEKIEQFREEGSFEGWYYGYGIADVSAESKTVAAGSAY